MEVVEQERMKSMLKTYCRLSFQSKGGSMSMAEQKEDYSSTQLDEAWG
jgi:hypothetical protein